MNIASVSGSAPVPVNPKAAAKPERNGSDNDGDDKGAAPAAKAGNLASPGSDDSKGDKVDLTA
jgi:hypothetical protein